MHRDAEERQAEFLELFLPIREGLWRFIRAMTRADRDTVDDVMSETVLRSFQGFGRLKDQLLFRSYCFTIARRVFAATLRERQRERDNRTNSRDISDHTAPDTSADIALLHEALARLPDRMRETLILFELSDLSLEDIRTIQGGTLSGVKSRLLRARAALQKELGETQAYNSPTAQDERTDSSNTASTLVQTGSAL